MTDTLSEPTTILTQPRGWRWLLLTFGIILVDQVIKALTAHLWVDGNATELIGGVAIRPVPIWVYGLWLAATLFVLLTTPAKQVLWCCGLAAGLGSCLSFLIDRLDGYDPLYSPLFSVAVVVSLIAFLLMAVSLLMEGYRWLKHRLQPNHREN